MDSNINDEEQIIFLMTNNHIHENDVEEPFWMIVSIPHNHANQFEEICRSQSMTMDLLISQYDGEIVKNGVGYEEPSTSEMSELREVYPNLRHVNNHQTTPESNNELHF